MVRTLLSLSRFEECSVHQLKDVIVDDKDSGVTQKVRFLFWERL